MAIAPAPQLTGVFLGEEIRSDPEEGFRKNARNRFRSHVRLGSLLPPVLPVLATVPISLAPPHGTASIQ